MPEETGNGRPSGLRNRRVHMANERTLLAWIRTSIGIMAFGFVVEKFAIFAQRIYLLLGQRGGEARPSPGEILPSSGGYPSVFSMVLIALGAVIGFLAFVRYKKVERQIETDTYQPSFLLNAMLVLTVVMVGIFLVIYIGYSLWF